MTPADAPTVFVIDDDAGVRGVHSSLLKNRLACGPRLSGRRKISYASGRQDVSKLSWF